jgi:hypothetical protein
MLSNFRQTYGGIGGRPRPYNQWSSDEIRYSKAATEEDGDYDGTGDLPMDEDDQQAHEQCWPFKTSLWLNILAVVLMSSFTIFAFIYIGVQFNQSGDPADANSTGTNPLYGHLTLYYGDSRQFSITYRMGWIIPAIAITLTLLFILNAVYNGMRYGMKPEEVAAFVNRGPGYWNGCLVAIAVIAFSTISFVALNVSGTTDVPTLLLYALASGLVPVFAFLIQYSRNSSYRAAYSEWALAKAAATAIQSSHNGGSCCYSEQDLVKLMEGLAVLGEDKEGKPKAVLVKRLGGKQKKVAAKKLQQLRAINDAIQEKVACVPEGLTKDEPPASVYAKGNSGILMLSSLLVVVIAFALTIGILSIAHQWENLRYAQRGLVILNFVFHGTLAVASIVIGTWGAKSGNPFGYHPFQVINLVLLAVYSLTMLSLSCGSLGYDGEFHN